MTWPTQSEILSLKSVYGNPRSPRDPGRPSAAWESANLVFIQPPFFMSYASQPLRRGFRMHKHCAPSMIRILNDIWDASGRDQSVIKDWGVQFFAGAAYFKTMTGNSRLLSMHSFGCAIDLDPARNGWKNRNPNFGKIPEVLRAFKKEGWRWGGDWNGNDSSADERSCDGMHWQATR
jgi:hypothetical protein